MTTLQTIFNDLSHGEFSQLQIGGFTPMEFESEPDPRQYAQLISHVNAGLRSIYSKFWLASDEIILDLYEQIEIYRLLPRYAQSNVASVEPIKYIRDTVEKPFKDNVLKVEMIYNEIGELLPLNDPTDEFSYYTPQWNSIQVQWPNDANAIAVMYRAAHENIVYTGDLIASEVDIDIPAQLYSALLYFIASRFHSGAGLEPNESAQFFERYQVECAEVERAGLFIQPEQNNWRFDNYGWV